MKKLFYYTKVNVWKPFSVATIDADEHITTSNQMLALLQGRALMAGQAWFAIQATPVDGLVLTLG